MGKYTILAAGLVCDRHWWRGYSSDVPIQPISNSMRSREKLNNSKVVAFVFFTVLIISAFLNIASAGTFDLRGSSVRIIPVHGTPFSIKEGDFDGEQIVYKDASGKVTFILISNIKNREEVIDRLTPKKEPPASQPYQASPSQPESNSSPEHHAASEAFPSESIDYPRFFTRALNTVYGNVCQAELNGFFSKTLKVDWTINTKKIHAIQILGEIGSSKDKLYLGGVRYFQFPNDQGTYNVIDWRTGEKRSNSELAIYFFHD